MILAAGLTPAWQQILCCERFTPGEVNRAREVRWCASGKVLNVGIALHHLGCESVTLAPLGGLTGQAIRQEFAATGIIARWVDCGRTTRVCTTIINQASGTISELVENAGPLTADELDAFRAAFRELKASAEAIVFSGSLPIGTQANLPAELLSGYTGLVVLDIRGPELLAAIAQRPALVKLNREELGHTFGHPLRNHDDLARAMTELLAGGAQAVAVTQGADAVWLATAGGRWRFTPPRIAVVNPIGSGDSMTAAIAGALANNAALVDAVRLGVAAGALNATDVLPARLSEREIGRLTDLVTVEMSSP